MRLNVSKAPYTTQALVVSIFVHVESEAVHTWRQLVSEACCLNSPTTSEGEVGMDWTVQAELHWWSNVSGEISQRPVSDGQSGK